MEKFLVFFSRLGRKASEKIRAIPRKQIKSCGKAVIISRNNATQITASYVLVQMNPPTLLR